MFLAAAGMGGLMLVLNALLGPRRPTAIKQEIFECGNVPTGDARERFNVKFYLVAILFLVFDIEVVFIYPWAVSFTDAVKGIGPISPWLALVEIATFVGIILVGLTYAWRKGALEWSGRASEWS